MQWDQNISHLLIHSTWTKIELALRAYTASRKNVFDDLDTRVRKRKIDNKTLMMLHEYWMVNTEHTSVSLVGIILAHNAIVYKLTPAEKKTHVSRSVRRPFHRCCSVIRLLRALEFGAFFLRVASCLIKTQFCFCIHSQCEIFFRPCRSLHTDAVTWSTTR